MGEYDELVDRMMKAGEPSVQWRVRTGVLGEDPGSGGVRRVREKVRRSARVKRMLDTCEGMYSKWAGAHWVLTQLGHLGYPEHDRALRGLADRGMDWARKLTVLMVEGRPRRCCSQEGNALLYAARLGFVDARCDEIADKLLACQWEDGGWNCDRKAEACHASFHESLIPMHALHVYGRLTGKRRYQNAARRASEMFLDRGLYVRKTTGEVIRPRFAATHYPYFWQYTFLYGLVVMVEMGRIGDARCRGAVELLESKRRPDGGFPAERKYYSVVDRDEARSKWGRSMVDWGPVSSRVKGPSNDFVTAEALVVLKAAGRL